MLHHLFLDTFRHRFECTHDVLDELLLLVGRQQAEQIPWLDVVIVNAALLLVAIRIALDLERWFAVRRIGFGAAKRVRLIVHRRTCVAIEAHMAVPLVIAHFC